MNIFITGATRGIGKAIKDFFEKAGHNVISPGREEMDLSNNDSVEKYLKSNDLGDIDILINNAGINELNYVENISYEELMKTIQVNLIASFILMKYFIPIFKSKKYGRIINIGSIWIEKTMPQRGSYGISKEGLYALTKMVAVENSKFNILCNMISPGFINTELTAKNNSEEQIKKIIERVPIGRLGQSFEVAKLVNFLTVDNTFITGQNIFIDGGYSINY